MKGSGAMRQMGRELGYGGKMCVVPRQTVIANEVFSPSPAGDRAQSSSDRRPPRRRSPTAAGSSTSKAGWSTSRCSGARRRSSGWRTTWGSANGRFLPVDPGRCTLPAPVHLWVGELVAQHYVGISRSSRSLKTACQPGARAPGFMPRSKMRSSVCASSRKSKRVFGNRTSVSSCPTTRSRTSSSGEGSLDEQACSDLAAIRAFVNRFTSSQSITVRRRFPRHPSHGQTVALVRSSFSRQRRPGVYYGCDSLGGGDRCHRYPS